MAATSNQIDLHTRLLAKHPDMPMKALWEALNDRALVGPEAAMAIVNDQRCGIERRSKVADGAITNPAYHITLQRATPLMLAALAGRDDVLEALLSLDAAVDAKEDRNGYTALHIAAVTDNSIAIKMLIANGSDVNATNNGDPPLQATIRNHNLEAGKLLIANGSDLKAVDKGGWTSLHWAAYSGYTEAFDVLVTNGCSLDDVDTDGSTPLHVAAGNGKLEAIKLLIAKGGDVRHVDVDGSTPLHNAASYGHPGSIELLTASGSDVNASDKEGRTALHRASHDYHLDAIEALVAVGSDLSVVDMNGKTPLMAFRSAAEHTKDNPYFSASIARMVATLSY